MGPEAPAVCTHLPAPALRKTPPAWTAARRTRWPPWSRPEATASGRLPPAATVYPSSTHGAVADACDQTAPPIPALLRSPTASTTVESDGSISTSVDIG